MSDPERITDLKLEKPAQAQKPPTRSAFGMMSSGSYAILVMWAVMIGSLAVLVLLPRRGPSPQMSQASWDAERQRQFANKLEAQGLKREAIQAYEQYLELADPSASERANLYYKLGKLHSELSEYEKALACYLKVEIADPKSKLADEIGPRIVECWERLGKDIDAQYALEQRAALDKPKAPKEKRGAVVAKIGDREISMGELDDAIQRMPWAASQLKSPQQKLQFLQQYIAGELLYQKAKKLRLDENPKVREQIADLSKQVLAQEVLKAEVADKTTAAPSDLMLYYEANKDRYKDRARARAAHILLDSEDKAAKLLAELKGGKLDFAEAAKQHSLDADTKDKGGELRGWIVKDGPVADLADAVLATDEGKLCDKPVKTDKGFHVVKVLQKHPEVQKRYDEVKQQVEQDYRMEKQQLATQELLLKLQQVSNVQIFEEHFGAEAAQKPERAKSGKP